MLFHGCGVCGVTKRRVCQPIFVSRRNPRSSFPFRPCMYICTYSGHYLPEAPFLPVVVHAHFLTASDNEDIVFVSLGGRYFLFSLPQSGDSSCTDEQTLVWVTSRSECREKGWSTIRGGTCISQSGRAKDFFTFPNL